MEDKILLSLIIKGDSNAFRILVERYCDALVVFAVRILKDNYLAEDIVQDAFEQIWSARKKLNPTLSIKSYLYGIVRNKCFVMLRSAKVSAKYRSTLTHISDDNVMMNYIETETIRLLTSAIETLPPRSAEVIRLSLGGMKQEQIAEEMGIVLATVKALKADGIKKLQKIMPAFTGSTADEIIKE